MQSKLKLSRVGFAILLLAPLLLMANPFVEAGKRYGIDPWLLYAIAKVESGLNPRAINYNKNGTMDLGIMQINTLHLPKLARYGITREHLFNPDTNIFVGAWILSGCIRKHGYSWNAVNCYNGKVEGNFYARKVYEAMAKEQKNVLKNNN